MIRITLTRYRRFHQRNSISIPPGLTVITGENGAGKSTLTQAILHALFAVTPRPTPQSDGTTEPFEVQLHLQGRHSELEVQLRGGHYHVSIDGTPHVEGRSGSQRAAQQVVTEYLGGLDRQAFQQVYFALQNETAALVGMTPSRRKELIEEVLQLDTVRAAVDLQAQRVKAHHQELASALTEAATVAASAGHNAGLQDKAAAYRRAVAMTTRLETLAIFEAAFAECLNRQRAAVEAQTEEVRAGEAAWAAAQAALTEVKSRLVDAEAEAGRWSALEKQRDGAQTQVTAAEAALKVCQQHVLDRELEVAEARQAEAGAQRHQQCVNDHQRVQSEWNHHLCLLPLAQQLAERTREVADVQAEHARFADLDAELHSRRTTREASRVARTAYDTNPFTAEIATAHAEERRLEAQRQETQQTLDQLERATEAVPCPTCNRPLSPQQRIERRSQLTEMLQHTLPAQGANLRALITTLEQREAGWLQSKQQADAELQTHDTHVQDSLLLIERRNNLQEQLIAARARLDETRAQCVAQDVPLPYPADRGPALQRSIRHLGEELKALEGSKSRFAQLPQTEGRLGAAQVKRHDAARQVEQLQEVLGAIHYDQHAHLIAKEDVDACRQAHTDGLLHESDAEHALKEARGELARANHHLGALHRGHAQVAAASAHLLREDSLLTSLGRFQDHFFAVNVREVMRQASRLLSTLTNQAIHTVDLDGEGNLFYRDQLRFRHPAVRLSGGEQALVGLCIRLALAERAQAIASEGRVKFLVLDEVLGSLDDERRRQVQLIFDTVLGNGTFDYIVMITHLDEVKNLWAAHRLEVRRHPSSGISTVTTLPSTWSPPPSQP